MTTISEITWPNSGSHRWLDSEFGPADVEAAKAALEAAGADAWVGYAPAGWPAHPWDKANFEAVLEAGAGAIALAVGPLAPTGGSAWALGAQLAENLYTFLKAQDLIGRVDPGLDVEAALLGRNEGFAEDMAGQFLATLAEHGLEGGIYGPWPLLAAVHVRFPGHLYFAWGTGNALPNESLDAPPGYPADATPGKRADQFAWNVDVAGINCDLSESQWAPVPNAGTPETAPTDLGSGAGETAPASSSTPPTGTDPAAPKTFDGLPVVAQGTTASGPGGFKVAAVTLAAGQQLDVKGSGYVAVIDDLAAVVYRGAADFGLGGEGDFLIVSQDAVEWAIVTQPGA